MSENYRYSGQGTCRSCGAALLWFTTPKGKQMPVDRDAFMAEQGGVIDLRGYEVGPSAAKTVLLPFTHWLTCPNAQHHRK